MKKKINQLDDFLRDSLEDLSMPPSEGARKKFIEEAGEMMNRPPVAVVSYRRIILLVLLLLISGGIAGYFLLSEKDKQVTSHRRTSYNMSIDGKSQANLPVRAEKVTKNQTTVITLNQSQEASHTNSQTLAEGQILTTPEKTEIRDSEISLTENQNNQQDKIPEKEITEDTIVKRNIPEIVPDNEPPPQKKTNAAAGQDAVLFNAGIYYTPEWVFNLEDEDGKYSNNFGFETNIRFHQYSVRTGIGLSVHQGSNEYAIGVQKYEGTYNKLEAINFEWDTLNYEYVPTIITTPQDVFDTAVVYTYQQIQKKYTYLQVPFILGYDFLNSEKFTIGLRAGPVLSVLLSSNEKDLVYDPGKDQVVQINNISPERIQTNWQITGGINFGWKINRRFTFEAEPQARYYFNSVYEKAGANDKPWSISLRTALLINFK